MIVPVVYVLMLSFLVTFGAALTSGFESVPVDETAVTIIGMVVITGGSLVTIALPYALYRDISILEAAGVTAEWEPDRTKFVLTAAFGCFVPGLSPLVSIYYLYQRRTYAGIR
ncbi:hypothetical protein [Halostagnicola bangensis]